MSPVDYIVVDEQGRFVEGTDSKSYPASFFLDMVEHFASSDSPHETQYLETHLVNEGGATNVTVLARKLAGSNWCMSVLDHEDLRLNRKNLEEKHFNLKSMLSVFAHEFRNPLASLTFAVDLMKDRCDEVDLIAVIAKNAKSMARMLDDLHDYQRFRDGQYKLEKTSVSVNSIIRDALRHFDPQSLHLHLENSASACINVDALRFEQVIRNVVGNSTKFQSSAPLKIKIVTAVEDGFVVIKIMDNGKGISRDEISKINLPFFQAKQDLSRQYGGLGLGLYISQTLVDLHNGSFEIFSEGHDKGTTVLITVPLDHNDPQAEATRDDGAETHIVASPEQPRTFHLLFVEDNPDLGMLLMAIFRKEKLFSATLANNGQEALELFKAHHYDLVVSDIGLPEMDGFELKKHFDELNKNGTQFIAMTGYSDIELKQRIQDSGFAKHLVKPVVGKKMILEVKELLGMK